MPLICFQIRLIFGTNVNFFLFAQNLFLLAASSYGRTQWFRRYGVRLCVCFVLVSVNLFPVAPNCSSPDTYPPGDPKESKTGTNSECECVCVALRVHDNARVINLF